MPFSVMGMSETWLTDCTEELVNITGYNFVSNHRKSKTGGGVVYFFHIFRKSHRQSLGRICREARHILPLSVWISEISLDIVRAINSFGE